MAVSRGTISQVAPTQPIRRTNYQNVIIVEFVACILLTALTPVATKTEADGLSPYAGKDIVKLGAITLLYFILAAIAVANQSAARFAAWFGGLILITDGMLEASNLAKDFAVFTGGIASAATASAAGTTPATLPIGTLPVTGTGSLFPVVTPSQPVTGVQNAGAAPVQGA